MFSLSSKYLIVAGLYETLSVTAIKNETAVCTSGSAWTSYIEVLMNPENDKER
jgi:hypothetical protein